MSGTIKISISMPEGEYKALEAARRKAKRTRSQFIREALEARGVRATDRAMPGGSRGGTGRNIGSDEVHEERGPYGSSPPSEIMDIADVRRRAIAAAGTCDSGVSDLSLEHDRYLTDTDAEDRTETGRPGQAVKDGEKP